MPTSLKLFDVFAILRRMMYAFLQSDGYKYQCDVIRSWWNRLYYNTNMQRLEMTKMQLESETLLYKHWYQWQRPQRKNIRAQRIRIWSLNRNSALPRATTKKKKICVNCRLSSCRQYYSERLPWILRIFWSPHWLLWIIPSMRAHIRTSFWRQRRNYNQYRFVAKNQNIHTMIVVHITYARVSLCSNIRFLILILISHSAPFFIAAWSIRANLLRIIFTMRMTCNIRREKYSANNAYAPSAHVEII